MKAKTFFGVLGLVMWVLPAVAQGEDVVMDLANHGEEEVRTVDPGFIVASVALKNLLPAIDYSVSIEKRRIPISPLSTENLRFAGGSLRLEDAGDAPDLCKPLNTALGKAKTEKEVLLALETHTHRP